MKGLLRASGLTILARNENRVEFFTVLKLNTFFLNTFLFEGTGSGLGTSVLNLLADEYPDVYRFTTAVYPSADDDVITSPYNRYMLCSYSSKVNITL